MKLPAVAITAAFAGGIAFGLYSPLAHHAFPPAFLAGCFFVPLLLVLAGMFLTRFQRLLPAAAASLLAWFSMGILGAQIADQPRPTDHVISLADAGRIDLKTPLRWHGRLRDEPAHLPWGYSYEIALSGVDYENEFVAAKGGLRLSFTPQPGQPPLPELHAGDELAAVTEARLPQVYKNEGAFDRRAYLAQQNIDLIATLRAPELVERVATPSPSIGIALARWRRRLRTEIDELFSATPQVAGVLRAMLLGDRSFIDRTEAADFQKTGVFHVLVVAGLHVGALAVFLFWMTRRWRLPQIWAMFLTLTLLFCYVAVVEQRPPVLRAVIMTTVVVLGGFFFRRLDLLNSAGVAALLLLVAKPLAVRDSSFQLTFLAIGCIAGLAAPWLEQTVQPYARALRGWRDVTRDATHIPRAAQFRIDLRAMARWISARVPQRIAKPAENTLAAGIAFSLRVWELFVLTLVLQIGMLPLMARDFRRITLSGPIANLAAVPLTGLIVPLGFFTLAAGLLVSVFGKLLAMPLKWLTLLLLHIVQRFAHLPWWNYRIPGPPAWVMALFFVAAVFLAVALRFTHAWRKWIALGACGTLVASALLLATYPFSPRRSKGQLEIAILDVGQGDSLFVVSPHGRTMLIDGGGTFEGFPGHEEHLGPDPGEDAVSPYLWSRGFQKLDVVVLTHAHKDHIGGMTAILENFPVGALWIGREVSSPALTALEELARHKKIPIAHELRGNTFFWDGVEGQFFWPELAPEETAPSPKNNDSLVLRLRYGKRSVLLPGDAEKQAERQILAENKAEALRADVLKIGHHGSRNSTTPEFLAAVQPRIAVISAGSNNPYSHPMPELLERLDEAGIWILRTDHDGAVHVLTDGERLEITCFVACPEPPGGSASGQAQSPDRQQKNEQQ